MSQSLAAILSQQHRSLSSTSSSSSQNYIPGVSSYSSSSSSSSSTNLSLSAASSSSQLLFQQQQQQQQQSGVKTLAVQARGVESWIKMVLNMQLLEEKTCRVCEYFCGSGTDLGKWARAKINSYTGIEVFKNF